ENLNYTKRLSCCASPLFRIALLQYRSAGDVAKMTFTHFAARMLQANSFTDVSEKLSVYTLRRAWSLVEGEAFAKGEQYPAVIKVLKQHAFIDAVQSKMLFFVHVGKKPRPLAQLLMPLVPIRVYSFHKPTLQASILTGQVYHIRVKQFISIFLILL
ncbi:Hypothetical predicted protein, partial [Xyrichtys novacula]